MELGLRPRDRILILGSSGWFGREFATLLPPDSMVLAVPGPSTGVATDDEQILDFGPTVVANFAFLTRERVESHGEDAFRRVNAELTERFLRSAQLPTVRTVLTISSGAAVHEPDQPYGQLKLAEEEAASSLVSPTRAVVVARAYSVSGPFVRRPREYAFSDLICQAMSGEMVIQAPVPVFRRYCSVTDVLRVMLRSGNAGRSGTFETGGPLVEMGELGDAIRGVIDPSVRIFRDWDPTGSAQRYHSDDSSWQEWTAAVSLEPRDLMNQIEAVAQGLRDTGT